MFSRFLLLFILLPLADLILIWMFLRLDIGLTILWIVLSGILGWWYVRRQGVQVMNEMRESIEQNKLPTDMLMEGAIVLFAGGLLITPGLLTDILGFSMLIRPCRRWYRKRFMNWLKKKVEVRTYSMQAEYRQSQSDVLDATVVGRKSTSESVDEETPVRSSESTS